MAALTRMRLTRYKSKCAEGTKTQSSVEKKDKQDGGAVGNLKDPPAQFTSFEAGVALT
jgi:hypothetical protein